MSKKGMSLVTLIITTLVMIGVFGITMFALTRTGTMRYVETTKGNMELLNLQQLANMAYASIYFDNLRDGIRRELTADEIRQRMIQNGTGKINIEDYDIVVKNGDVFVRMKGDL